MQASRLNTPVSGSPRILIVRTDRIGDVILSTPVIRTLRKAFPGAYLGMMVRPEVKELVEGHPDLNVVLLYDKEGSEKGLLGNIRFALRLKAHRFDTALILHSTNRVILVTFLAGIRRRIGYRRRLGWLLTDSIRYVKREGSQHELEYNLDLLRFLGVQEKDRTPSIARVDRHESKILAFLRAHGVTPPPAGGMDGAAHFVTLHPGASCISKRWPADRFAQLADRMIERYGVKVVVVTGPKEVPYGEAVVGFMRHPALRAFGTLSLGELACLLQRSICLISNDSGPVHLACAVGTPVVAIFGRWGGGLSPTRWGPTGEHSTFLHRDVGCRPCLAHRCPIGFVCLKAISVDEVLAASVQLAGFENAVPSD